MTYTLPLSQIRKKDIETAGGKGVNLGELTTVNLPVPPGFVLTTSAYTQFVQVHNLQSQILELAGSISAAEPQSADATSVKIRQLFDKADMLDEITQALSTAYEELGATAVAVRSSATAEDLPQASFAGQQETFLNVQGPEPLLTAVKACWASLWTARALTYRARLGIEPKAVSMAVVIQKMVPAALSGILFTANPTSGARDELVVNASFGLGEAVVSGQVTPDSYLLSRENMAVKETTLGSKEIMIVPESGQNTAVQPIPKTQQSQPTLTPSQLAELGAMGIQVQDLFEGIPQDIEWAWVDGIFWLLQARPITNLPPAPLRDVRWEPPRPGTIWMRRQIVEHMPEPLSPLFDELYLEEGLDQSMESLAVFMSDLSNFEIKLWDFIDPPFATTINGYAYSTASFKIDWKILPLALRLYIKVLPKMIRHLVPHWRDEAIPSYQARIAQWQQVDLATASDEELLRGMRLLAAEDAIYWFAAAVPLGFARMTDSALDGFLKSVSNGRGRLTSGSFLRGFPSKAAEAQAELEAIAAKINESETLTEQVVKKPATRLLNLLAEHPEGTAVLADLAQYLDKYGHQIYNLDFATPTLADDPIPVLLSLKTAVANPQQDVHNQQAKMAQERDALTAELKRTLDPFRRWLFQLLLGWAQRYTPYREEALFYVGAGWPALRRLALELGRRLTESGSLAAPDHVFYLRSAELAAAARARAEGTARPDLAALARQRVDLRQARKRLEPPPTVPLDGRMKFGPIDMAMFEPKPRTSSSGPSLDGHAVSPGQVTAPASVIRSPEEFHTMMPGTILVCTTTTPAWTPLFAQAKGLVTDIGGALAHGSIVAREYGIPAVMGTGVATQRISGGQRIRVDGDQGTVTLIDEVDPEAEARSQAQRLADKQAAARKRKAILALAGGFIVLLVLWWKKRH